MNTGLAISGSTLSLETSSQLFSFLGLNFCGDYSAEGLTNSAISYDSGK
jgi:hypothetical protein